MNHARIATDLIGRTPLLRLERPCAEQRVFAKCEFMNPISIKDRPVLQIILDAESEGRLAPGDTLIEVTSGNTGMAVAWIAAIKGYRAILVMSEIQSVERRPGTVGRHRRRDRYPGRRPGNGRDAVRGRTVSEGAQS